MTTKRRTRPIELRGDVVGEARRRGITLALSRKRWCPHEPTPKQAEFLALNCKEALYGGAAGGGKSDALLMAALQHVDKPNYAALILRRTYKDLALPGAIMDRAGEWLRGTDARWVDDTKTWHFPAGATLTFGYLESENDKYRYQGAELQFIAFDELTQFAEQQYRYLFSRLRRAAGSDVPIRMRAASNPGGLGHDWVYDRFVNLETRGDAVFVPALLADNPHVDAAEYRESLALLDKTTRDQLEHGSWIRDVAGLIYHYTQANLVTELPKVKEWRRVLAIDYGSSQIVPSTAFCVWLFSRETPNAYLAESRKYAGLTPSTIAEHARALAIVHGAFHRMVGDQGGLGGGYNEEMRAREKLPIQNVEKRDKLGFRKLFRGALEQGRILILNDGHGCNDAWREEAQRLSWDAKGLDAMPGQPDHVTDSGLYGWRECRAYRFTEEESQPAPGSKEAYDLDAKRYREQAERRVATSRRDDFFGPQR